MAHNTIKEMKEILDAIEQGKPIQAQTVDTDCTAEWDNNTSTMPNFFSFRYRVKPEAPKKRWRPFNDVDEFLKAAGGLGAIWLKSIEYNQMRLLISVDYDEKERPIRLDFGWVAFDTLLESFTFADGTPCGVEEEEK